MIHPRYFDFTKSELIEMDSFHRQLFDLAEFLRTDPRPHQEGKFDMLRVSKSWNYRVDDPHEALSRCGTAACACGWETLRSGDKELFENTVMRLDPPTANWMFSSSWTYVDNTPYGAHFRITHYLRNRDRSIYSGNPFFDKPSHYPADPFWLEDA